MKIDDREFSLAREMAKLLNCTPKEAIELSLQTMASLFVDDPSGAILRSMRALLQDMRAEKRSEEGKAIERNAKERAEHRREVAKRAEAPARSTLKHNPFKVLGALKEGS